MFVSAWQFQVTHRFTAVFTCGWTVILLFDGLGVDDQGFRQSRSYYKRFHIGGLHQTEDTDGMNNKLQLLLLLFLLTFSDKSLSLCLPDSSGVCKMIGPMLKFDAKY
jgi:hypothetical protein